MTLGDKIMVYSFTTILVLSCVIFIYPMWMTLVQSLSEPHTADSLGFKLWPKEWSFSAYEYLLTSSPKIWIGYKNSIINTSSCMFGHLLVTYLGGYALSRRDLPFKSILTLFICFTMFFSGGLIPSYLLMRNLGLMGSRLALILPSLTSAWDLIIMRNFMKSLPYELEESAEIDGAHPLRIVFQVLLPLSKPVLAVIALWVAVGTWNSYFDAMLYNNTDELKTLGLAVRELTILAGNMKFQNSFQAAGVGTEPVKAATIIVAVVPILCLYPYLQKYFVKGLLVGSLKG